MAKNLKKRKFNEFKKTRIVNDDDNDELIKQEKSKDKKKQEDKKEEDINEEQYELRSKAYALIEKGGIIDNNKKDILTASAVKFVKSVVKLNMSQYDIVNNDEITIKGNDKKIRKNNSWKSLFDIMIIFEGCKVEIHKFPIKQDKLSISNSEEKVKLSVTLDDIITFNLIIIKEKNYVHYQPINILIQLKEEDKFLYNELEIPKADLSKLIHILNRYKHIINKNNQFN